METCFLAIDRLPLYHFSPDYQIAWNVPWIEAILNTKSFSKFLQIFICLFVPNICSWTKPAHFIYDFNNLFGFASIRHIALTQDFSSCCYSTKDATKQHFYYSKSQNISINWCSHYWILIASLLFFGSYLLFHFLLLVVWFVFLLLFTIRLKKCSSFFFSVLFFWSPAQRTTIVSTSLRILVQKLLLKFFETFESFLNSVVVVVCVGLCRFCCVVCSVHV